MPSERAKRRVDRLLGDAEGAADRGDWAAVVKRCDEVLAFDSENEDAKAFLAAARKQLEGIPEAPDAGGRAPVGPGGSAATSASAPERFAPTSFAAGRYVVKKFLGEGGKKRVYLAHDTTLDRDVAFALIKIEGLDDTSRQRITREAQAMARLGDHPNIVPIFDMGQETDPASRVHQPFMVIPVMSGGDVERAIEEAPDHRLPLERVLQVAKDTCEGLAFAHSKGIVHRDLKPGNVWLTQEGRARIGDFGLAVATDRSRLTREAVMVGTVAYMPPEQAMGGEITPRADLYSLGAMLYEMVTGRPPFLGDDDIAIIGQHINTPPVAPGWHNPQCPKPLEALIMRLLAKDPAQRPETAKDVLAALQAVTLAPLSAAAASPATTEGKPEQGRSLDSMSSGVFVGRHKEMDQLRAALEEALSGHGRMVTLVGEPGIGKTRTAQELATYAGLRRCQVLWGRCYEGGGAPPYWPWVQAIRQYVQERDSDQLRREMGSSASVVAEIVPDVRDRLPGLLPATPLESPESARFRLFDSIASFLRSAARNQALAIVLDDLHWSDKPSLLLLEFIAREIANARVLLIGTYRDVELNRRHPLAVTLGELTKERLFERVLLRGLRREDVERFIELSAGVATDSGLVDAVFTQTEGNPLFVTEVVRLLIQEGQLAREPAGQKRRTTTWIVRVPEGVREVIGRRLDRLSERCNEVLTTASVIGRSFTLGQLLAVANDASAPPGEHVSEDRLLEALEEALSARLIEELRSAVGEYQFTHALIQDTLMNELSTTRRVRLHARIAMALEKLYGSAAAEHASALARHFGEAEAVLGAEKLIYFSLVAGERAIRDMAYEDALAHFSRALHARGEDHEDETLAALLAGAARAELSGSLQFSQERALGRALRAFRFYKGKGDAARALDVACIPFRNVWEDYAEQITREGLELAPPDSRAACLLLSRRALQLAQRGNPEGTLEIADRAVGLAERLGEPNAMAWAQYRKFALLNVLGRHEGEAQLLESAIELARETRDPDVELLARAYLGLYLIDSGRAGAWAQVDHSLQLALTIRDRARIVQATFPRTRLLLLEGRWDEVRAAISTDADFLDAAHLTRVVIACRTGDTSAASAEVSAAITFFQHAPPSIFRAFGIASVAFACHRGSEGQIQALETLPAVTSNTPAARLATSLRDAIVALHTNDSVLAEQAYEVITAWPFVCLHQAVLPGLLGEIQLFLRNAELAIQHLNRAMEICEAMKWLPELGWASFWRGEAYALRGEAGDSERTRESQDQAMTIAQRLAMKPLIERIIAKRRLLKA